MRLRFLGWLLMTLAVTGAVTVAALAAVSASEERHRSRDGG